MRGFASYVVTGILVVLALDFIAPPVGLGLSVAAWPDVGHGSTLQSVDRTNKSDRMPLSTAVGKRQTPRKPPAMLVGCEPVFSPLSASAHANFSGRCVA
ncbi:MAG: hypothetical protein HY543_03045 [Deltaproteobacteria bacterium]|nr:hypothetical protein [Deltaproteobacteria bacterium]